MSYGNIQASEIANYVYCRRSWWLQREGGYAKENKRELTIGNQHHEEHGRSVEQAYWLRRLAYVLLFVAVTVITFQILIGLWGI